jgi:protein TonB
MKAAGTAAIVALASSLIWAGGGATPQPTPPADAWEKTPSADDLGKAAPPLGTRDAYTRIRCDVRPDGGLRNCVIIEETPKGQGYGRAALKAARYFKMRPRAAGGRPAPRTVIVPIRWVLSDEPTPASSRKAQEPRP